MAKDRVGIMDDYLFEIHYVHIISLLTILLIPVLMVNTNQQEDLFASWENRKFNSTEIVDPLVPFCDGALQTIYASQEGGWAGIIAEVLFGDVEIVDVVTTLVVSRLDAPWWYITETGPTHPCSRLLVMAWDVVGFPDVNDTMGQSAGLDCAQQVDGVVCGGRSLDVLGLDFALAGFPLVWDIDHLGATVETSNLDYYRSADALIYVLPIVMILSSVYWLCTLKTSHFMYTYALVWGFLLVMLLFPFPAFVIAKVDPKTSTNTEDYLTHIVVFTEDDERVDYYLYLQWMVNAIFSAGSALTFQYPYVIVIGSFAIFFSITDSLQEVGDEDVHTISTIMEILITGVLAFISIFVVSVLSTFRPSMEQSIREEAWVNFKEDWGDPFVNTVVVGYVVTAFLLLYLNFLFDRLYVWYDVITFWYLRLLCILATIICIVSAEEEVNLAATDAIPTSYFFYVAVVFFFYNFICGRFVFFIFYRPHLIDDPMFGWYRVSSGGKYGLYVERLFDVSKRTKKDELPEIEMLSIENSSIGMKENTTLNIINLSDDKRSTPSQSRESYWQTEEFQKNSSPTLYNSPPPPPVPAAASRNIPSTSSRSRFDMPRSSRRIPARRPPPRRNWDAVDSRL